MADNFLSHLRPDDVVLDNLPDSLQAGLEVRKRFLKNFTNESGELEFMVADLQKWRPGESVTVAFLGGNTNLHREIVEATEAITDVCNLTLDFGYDERTDSYRKWSESDENYAASIRVSFDKSGYWSLVGTDSINPRISLRSDDVGGHPHQRSLNLSGFDVRKPEDWKGVVRHEFLHALAFHHEHQNMRGPCANDFRWEDEPGYQPTRDAVGRYIPDFEGRLPGIYTYLAGYPNFWSQSKVDHNLRTEENPQIVAGPFDSASIMLYQFPPLFYRTPNSPCAPTGDGIELSEGDIRGLKLLYGEAPEARESSSERMRKLAAAIESAYPETQNESAAEGLVHSVMTFIKRSLGE